MHVILLCVLCISTLLVPSASECVNGYPEKLDVAIYWARTGKINDKITWSKSCGDTLSDNFDPNKKTIIMVHGLQPGMVKDGEQMASDGELDITIKPWLILGYNFGIFQWTNFADEAIDDFVFAEDKIYSPLGLVKMQYRVLTGKGTKNERVRLLDAPTDSSVADYFVSEWQQHFSDPAIESYPEIRIVGHSLGTQLTVKAAHIIHNTNNIRTKPARIALLDAVMSPRPKMYFSRSECGRTVSQNMGCMVTELTRDRGVAIEYYKSSFINRCIFSSHENTDLIEYTAYSVVTMTLWGEHPLGSCWDSNLLKHRNDMKHYLKKLSYQINMQHVYIVPYYLLSIVQPPHVCVRNGTQCTLLEKKLSISAAMSTSAIMAYSSPDIVTGSKTCFHQYQDQGTSTITPYDDLFYMKDCKTAHT